MNKTNILVELSQLKKTIDNMIESINSNLQDKQDTQNVSCMTSSKSNNGLIKKNITKPINKIRPQGFPLKIGEDYLSNNGRIHYVADKDGIVSKYIFRNGYRYEVENKRDSEGYYITLACNENGYRKYKEIQKQFLNTPKKVVKLYRGNRTKIKIVGVNGSWIEGDYSVPKENRSHFDVYIRNRY